MSGFGYGCGRHSAQQDSPGRPPRELGVREGTYHLYGAHLGDAIVMDHRPDGWVVFYSERGEESALRLHTTEADACADLLDRLIRDEHVFFDLVAGPAPASEADAAFDSWLSARAANRATLVASDWKFDDVALGRRPAVASILRSDNCNPPSRFGPVVLLVQTS